MLGGLEKLNLFDVAAGAEKLLDLHLRGIPGDLRDLGNLRGGGLDVAGERRGAVEGWAVRGRTRHCPLGRMQ